MRCLNCASGLVIVLMLCFGPVEAQGGKGGGGGGGGRKPSYGGCKNCGPKSNGHKPMHAGPKHSGPKDQLAEKHPKPLKDKHVKDHRDADSGSGEPVPMFNKKEKQLQLAQQQRDKKLAQAEHLREIAERNGNTELAANADRMEAQALQQYEQKVAHLEKFGVTDPSLADSD